MTEHQSYLVDAASSSSRLEAPESNQQFAADCAGRSIRDENRTAILFRHSGWEADRCRMAESFARTRQPNARTEAFHACGYHAYVLQNADDPDHYRVAGSCCRDRFCLPCAHERSAIIAGNVTELLGDREIRFLTLTIKTDDEPLTESLDKLYDAFQALRRRQFWKRHVTGGVAFMELKYSHKGHRWHPHLHCLIEGTWLDKKRLQSLWYEITGDSWIVDIRRPANNNTVAAYVTKYASKPFNTSFTRTPVLLDEAVMAMKGRKLCITFGRWRGKLLTAVPSDGVWIQVGPLSDIIQRAANGHAGCCAIMASLTDRDLTSIYERAPPGKPTSSSLPPPDTQCDWFGAWQADGTYKYRND